MRRHRDLIEPRTARERLSRAVLSRRALLGVGLVAGLAACDRGSPGEGGSAFTAASSSRDLGAAPASGRTQPLSALAAKVRGPLWLPGSSGYTQGKLTENPRFDGCTPLGVLRVADAKDLAAAITFARANHVPLAMRSGGHSYPGWSAGGGSGTGVPDSLVLDCRALSGISFSGTRVTVGAGVLLARLYAALAVRGRGIAAGSCPTVGVSGLTLGGGVGVLTRAHGLTCDALTSAQIVTADARIRVVDGQHDADLFWALRGGGGGHLGVVTSLTFDTFAAPTVHTFYLRWPLSQASQVVAAWQAWAPGADSRMWSTLKMLGGAVHAGGPVLLVSGTWIGPGAPNLSGLLAHCPAPAARSSSVRSFGAAMASFAGCASVPVEKCHTGAGGALTREAFAATSHVGYRRLAAAGVQSLIAHVQKAQGSGLKEAGVSLDALGGAVGAVDPAATAFVHRKALMTVQYTATYTGSRAAAALSFVRGMRAAMTSSWGQSAYVNYADSGIANPMQAYFGANADRLTKVRSRFDPDRVFSQPVW